MLPLISKNILLDSRQSLSRVNWEFVRYRLKYKIKEPLRKPVWQPMAPSKLFRIKQKEELTSEEKAQREHLQHTYSINMKSIKNFLREEFYLPTLSAGGRSQEEVTKEEEEQQRLFEENDRENEKISNLRTERMNMFRKDKEAELIAQQLQIEQENIRHGKELDEIVKREIVRSKTYITKENLDIMIEEALAHETSYDFAIDTNGKLIYSGTLHPYALTPRAVPETSSNSEEYKEMETNKPLYIKPRRLF